MKLTLVLTPGKARWKVLSLVRVCTGRGRVDRDKSPIDTETQGRGQRGRERGS